MGRANNWISYNVNVQLEERHGYHTTDMGFLAMCWVHNEPTFTHEELMEAANEVPYWAMEEGDAIVCDAKVWLFVRWLDKRKTHFVNLEIREETGDFVKSISRYPPSPAAACSCLRNNIVC